MLKDTGCIYLHCDSAASHCLKLLLDSVFGLSAFQNEIIWKRTLGSTSIARRFRTQTDTILLYTKSKQYTFKPQFTKSHLSAAAIEKMFPLTDPKRGMYYTDNLANPDLRPNLIYEYKGYKPPEKGWAISREKMEEWDKQGRLHFPDSKSKRIRRKRFLSEWPGSPVQNLWIDIHPIGAHAKERLGYPTQKPQALLERIIAASSNEGDVVLDPFCGCGTAVAAAEKLNRRWIGIDVTHLAVNLMKQRLLDSFGIKPKKDYAVIGEPESLSGAKQLASENAYQFQYWALGLVGARPHEKRRARTGV